MGWVVGDFFGAGEFNYFPQIHDSGSLGKVFDDIEIMRNKKHGQVFFLLERLQ